MRLVTRRHAIKGLTAGAALLAFRPHIGLGHVGLSDAGHLIAAIEDSGAVVGLVREGLQATVVRLDTAGSSVTSLEPLLEIEVGSGFSALTLSKVEQQVFVTGESSVFGEPVTLLRGLNLIKEEDLAEDLTMPHHVFSGPETLIDVPSWSAPGIVEVFELTSHGKLEVVSVPPEGWCFGVAGPNGSWRAVQRVFEEDGDHTAIVEIVESSTGAVVAGIVGAVDTAVSLHSMGGSLAVSTIDAVGGILRSWHLSGTEFIENPEFEIKDGAALTSAGGFLYVLRKAGSSITIFQLASQSWEELGNVSEVESDAPLVALSVEGGKTPKWLVAAESALTVVQAQTA